MTDTNVNPGLQEKTDGEILDYVNGLGVMAVNDGLDEFNQPGDYAVPFY